MVQGYGYAIGKQSWPDIGHKVNDVIERRKGELKEVEAKTGWKPAYKKQETSKGFLSLFLRGL